MLYNQPQYCTHPRLLHIAVVHLFYIMLVLVRVCKKCTEFFYESNSLVYKFPSYLTDDNGHIERMRLGCRPYGGNVVVDVMHAVHTLNDRTRDTAIT